jgi:DNA polymerase-3 subunit gamma/tau
LLIRFAFTILNNSATPSSGPGSGRAVENTQAHPKGPPLMSYLVLARKYRPCTFEEVVQQEHVTRTLANAITAGRVAHAILFAGPRGTGKTTVARILAKAMNCGQGPTPTPCNACRSCREIAAGNAADVFEIDGASNNSVDQVRELRENAKYLPAASPFKIYIIDEVHMLSTPAFNALLKTLEEPPAHVMFQFATTEPQKIPLTILSRCQRYDLKRIPLEALTAHMAELCRREGMALPVESLRLMAREAGGSMRDALSLLDQVLTCAQGEITHDEVLTILGLVDRELVFNLSAALIRGDAAAVIDGIGAAYERGHDLKRLYGELTEHARNLVVSQVGRDPGRLMNVSADEAQAIARQAAGASMGALVQMLELLFREEASVRLAAQPRIAVEMALLHLCQVRPALAIDEMISKIDGLRKALESGMLEPDSRGAGTAPVPGALVAAPQTAEPGATEAPADPPPGPFSESDPAGLWEQVYRLLAERHPSLAPHFKDAVVVALAGERLDLEVQGSDFVLGRARRPESLESLSRIVSELLGRPITVVVAGRLAQLKKKDSGRDQRLKQEAWGHPLVTETMDLFQGKLVDVKVLKPSDDSE